MSIIVIGIDLAKNIFAVHGVDENGHAELVKPKVSREQLLPLIANLPPCLIGMEACSGAHHWTHLFRVYVHTIKLIAPRPITACAACYPNSASSCRRRSPACARVSANILTRCQATPNAVSTIC